MGTTTPIIPASWMSALPNDLMLRQICMPGSHHALSQMTHKDDISPDISLPDWVKSITKRAPFILKIIKKQIVKWGQAQSLDIDDQLQQGIRYLDLRLAKNPNDGQYYTCHGLFSTKTLQQNLNDIAQFIKKNPKEVILLDCRQFHGLSPVDHSHIIHLFESIFKGKIAPSDLGADVTLGDLWALKRQIMIIYHDDLVANLHRDVVWRGGVLHSEWPNKVTINALKSELDRLIAQSKDNGKINVTQALMTPGRKTVIVGLLFGWIPGIPASLKDLAGEVSPAIGLWMKKDWCDKSINVLMTDNVDAQLLNLTCEHNDKYQSKPSLGVRFKTQSHSKKPVLHHGEHKSKNKLPAYQSTSKKIDTPYGLFNSHKKISKQDDDCDNQLLPNRQ